MRRCPGNPVVFCSLKVSGEVNSPREFSYYHLRSRPSIDRIVTLECQRKEAQKIDPLSTTITPATTVYSGWPLFQLLHECGGLTERASSVLFRGADVGVVGGQPQHYEWLMPVSEVLATDTMVAWAMNGRELEPQHGFPLRYA